MNLFLYIDTSAIEIFSLSVCFFSSFSYFLSYVQFRVEAQSFRFFCHLVGDDGEKEKEEKNKTLESKLLM